MADELPEKAMAMITEAMRRYAQAWAEMQADQ